MSTSEFETDAGREHQRLAALDPARALRSACRGSGNPAELAWIAEALEVDDRSLILDVGGGLGGPARWFEDRYSCRVLDIDPVADAARAATDLFGITSIVGAGSALPIRSAAVDRAVLFGVVSVVADPIALLVEVRRVARAVGVLCYCAQHEASVHTGGSRFPSASTLTAWLHEAGWSVPDQPRASSLPAPRSWHDTDDEPTQPSEQAVVDAIENGHIAAALVVAHR